MSPVVALPTIASLAAVLWVVALLAFVSNEFRPIRNPLTSETSESETSGTDTSSDNDIDDNNISITINDTNHEDNDIINTEAVDDLDNEILNGLEQLTNTEVLDISSYKISDLSNNEQ